MRTQLQTLEALQAKASQAATRINLRATKALLRGFNLAAERYLEESQVQEAKALRFQALADRLVHLNNKP